MSAPSQETSFEVIVQRLESIAKSLESGEPKLEEALALFEEGVKLSKLGTQKLDQAEKRIEVLLQGDDTAPFSPDSES